MKFFYQIVCAVCVVCAVVACTDEKVYRIGVAQCSKGRWREKVNQEMLAAQHLFERDVRVSIANSFDDSEWQARQIDSLAQTGIDLLVVAPNEDTQVINDAVARVREAGIPVICFDRKTSADYTAFIGGNNIEAGYIVGQYVASLVRGERRVESGERRTESGEWREERGERRTESGQRRKPMVMEITGHMGSTPAQERHRGFDEAMRELPEAEYVCRRSDWSSDSACYYATWLIDSLLRADSSRLDYTIVFCHNDGMATGVYKAAVEQNVDGRVKILGIDGMPGEGLEYVKLGHQIGTYYYPTHGEKIVRLALDILTGKAYERENPLLGFVVTPDNVDLVTTESVELMRQNGHMITIQDKLEAYLGLYDTQRKVLIGSFVAIVMLVAAFAMMWRAYVQTRRVIRQRQTLNEEETLLAMPVPRSQDTIFAENLNAAIRKNMANPNLKMDELGEEMGLGRVQLYRKVKAITGLTPVELLRKIRLQQGYVLLTTTTKTVAEIAFEVGFNTPGYFSKCFKEQYGKLPGELRVHSS